MVFRSFPMIVDCVRPLINNTAFRALHALERNNNQGAQRDEVEQQPDLLADYAKALMDKYVWFCFVYCVFWVNSHNRLFVLRHILCLCPFPCCCVSFRNPLCFAGAQVRWEHARQNVVGCRSMKIGMVLSTPRYIFTTHVP